jgi:predicted site-specific integrase-resolvase
MYTSAHETGGWARPPGLEYQTACRWFRTGILPVPSKQLPSGTILVEPHPLAEKHPAAVYARVSKGDVRPRAEARQPLEQVLKEIVFHLILVNRNHLPARRATHGQEQGEEGDGGHRA